MVKVCILTGYGINSDYESKYAFELAGADVVDRVHLKDLIEKRNDMENYHILMLPGGFAFGDHLGSGRVMGNKFRFNLRNELNAFIEHEKLIFGVCNGFQILVKMGVLPRIPNYSDQIISLVGNNSGHYEDRWVQLKVHESPCIWTKNYEEFWDIPVRHGEGKFIVENNQILQDLWEKKLVALTYSPNKYPNNPNGSTDGIAGICDPSGRIFGLMPHPECHIMRYHHPQWTRGYHPTETGLKIFQNGVKFARDNLT